MSYDPNSIEALLIAYMGGLRLPLASQSGDIARVVSDAGGISLEYVKAYLACGAGEAGLVERWRGDYGIILDGDFVTEWIGKRGTPAYPITPDQGTTIISGTKVALNFNGSTHGMIANLSRLSRALPVYTLTVHCKPSGTTGDQTVVRLANAGVEATSRFRLFHLNSQATRTYASYGDSGAGQIYAANSWGNTERVYTVVRGSGLWEFYIDGVRTVQTTETAEQPLTAVDDLSIGFRQNDPSGWLDFFSGSIREISIHNRMMGQNEILVYAGACLA